MSEPRRAIIKVVLGRRLESLGYLSLRKFHADRREIGVSYELLRQVVRGGRVPRAETLIRILRAMRFSPPQTRKIMELCGLALPPLPSGPGPGVADEGEPPPPAIPQADAQPRPDEGKRPRIEPPPAAEEEVAAAIPAATEDPAEIAAALARTLPRIPFRGNEDFWEGLAGAARLAERKVRDQARRLADQPLLFEKEPEALYQFLVRRGKVPPYMSKGEGIALGFLEGVDYRDRYRGALLGAAVGERLGRVTQGISPRDVEALFGRIDGPLSGRSAGAGRGAAGPSPATVLVLARTLVQEGRLDPEKAAAGYAAVATGTAVEFARNLAERDYPWFEAGVAAAEGVPAARVAPLALLRADDFRRMKLEAGIDAAITHPNGGAIAGAVAQAAAVARILHTPPGALDVIGFTRSLAPAIAGIEPDRPARGRSAKPSAMLWRKLGTELTALLLRRADVAEIREILGNGPPVQESVPFAWGCFLRYPDDIASAVLSAVNMGNDAESCAAIAGALGGAYVGASGIPARLLEGLSRREEIAAAADGILALARRAP